MELRISDGEAAALRSALESYLSDLRMEIRDTESWELRQRLKTEADLLDGLWRRLVASAGGAAS